MAQHRVHDMGMTVNDGIDAKKVDDVIKVVSGKIEEIEIPEQVDMIISEPMGYMLLNERMLETFLHAKKFLKPGGRMFPSRWLARQYLKRFSIDILIFESRVVDPRQKYAHLDPDPGLDEHADPDPDPGHNSWLTQNLKNISKLDY